MSLALIYPLKQASPQPAPGGPSRYTDRFNVALDVFLNIHFYDPPAGAPSAPVKYRVSTESFNDFQGSVIGIQSLTFRLTQGYF